MDTSTAADAQERHHGDVVFASVTRDLSDPSLLPPPAPLAMPPQDFSADPRIERARAGTNAIAMRVALFGGAALATFAFGYELQRVLSIVGMTPLQIVFLILSTMAFGWIAVGSLSAALGFISLYNGDRPDNIELPDAQGVLDVRTALLFPVYHEDPARIAGTIEAMVDDLARYGRAGNFDVFVLSDTRGDDAGAAEQQIYRELAERLAGTTSVYYRQRRENKARKAGNIKDWVERFGAAYPHFIILDGDSVMSGETVIRLSRAMAAKPKAGLIQTVPRLTGGTTLLQRLQQFASQVYGPIVAAGMAMWTGSQGNYWGHNAIIRTQAFASAAGLPDLPGRPPFGGHIQSHDFVEAVLLQRAGYGVHMAPTLDGSYEGLPPTLAELVVRDRRWAQGNLQHLSIVGASGITSMGRLHLAMGALSYLVSAIWAASLVVGIFLALQSQRMIPNYFPNPESLFPTWPVMDAGAAARLFLGTMLVVLLPKVLGLILEIRRARAAREDFGTWRAVFGGLVETVFSILLAPILMLTQTVAVTEILLGRDSGWKAQRRANGEVTLGDAFRFHTPHMVLGIATAVISYNVAPALVAWMSPVILGLVLAGFVGWLVAQPAGPMLSLLLSTPEDRNPPPVLRRALAAAEAWQQRLAERVATAGAANAAAPGLTRSAA